MMKKNTNLRNLWLILWVSFSVSYASIATATTNFYLAPAGDDTNPGSAEQPVATLARARDLVRQLTAAGLKEDVQVLLHGGTYYLSETLALDSRDSGTRDHSITYAAFPGESVIISGGRPITGWKPADNSLWSVVIPEAAAGQWYFRELYVNDRRAIRARRPNADDKEPYYIASSAALSDDLQTWEVHLKGKVVNSWKNLGDVEFVALPRHDGFRKQISAVKNGDTILFKPPHLKPYFTFNLPQTGSRCYLENAFAFLDEPGEWYLDRTSGTLSYWPRPSDDMRQAQVIAPVLIHLIRAKGSSRQPLRNLHFQGLTFAHTTWNLPPIGYLGYQASFHYPDLLPKPLIGRECDYLTRLDGGLSFEYADSCSLENCRITHMEACGAQFRRGSVNNLIQGNEITDIGATGLIFGENLNQFYYGTYRWPTNSSLWVTEGANPADPANHVVNNRVLNNLIHACGVDYCGGVGIWGGFVERMLIANNLIYDLPYSGVSLGWDWGPNLSPCKGNTVINNHVHDVMKSLIDGAAIYTLGNQPGSLVKGNLVHDIPESGLYFDNGSEGFLVEDNVVYNTGTPFNFCYANRQTLRNNLFAKKTALTKGVVGWAMSFADDFYIDTPHNPVLDPPVLTAEAWVKFYHFTQRPDPCVWIINKNSDEMVDGHYALAVSHRNVGAYLNIGGGRDNCFAAWSSGGPVLSNAWNHLAMTYDGHDLKVYCNGVLSGSTAVNRPRSAGTGILRINRRADNYNIGVYGEMDEIRLYNRALSAEELTAHFTHPAPLTVQQDPSLVAAWPFDDWQQKIQHAVDEAGPQEPYRTRFGISKTSQDTNGE